jgi:hypothetical protein
VADDVIEREINLLEWFPANDNVATAVARLCVIREDFYLVGLGLAAESIPCLDENGRLWRRLYFFRQLSVVLMEAKKSLMVLNQDKLFAGVVNAENFRKEILNFEKTLNSPALEDLRNWLGAHLNYSQVGEALKSMDPSTTGNLQVGKTHRATHFGFAANIVAAMLPEEKLAALAEVQPMLLDAVDRIISAYYELKKLE